VTEIGKKAFSYCSSLENITIPDAVTEIGKDAFKRCNTLKTISVKEESLLRDVGLPEEVEIIVRG
jgi:hypothetical protein